MQYNPAISGNKIVWEDERHGNRNIYLAEIPTPDSTPPTGSIKINNGAQFTGTASVTLNLSASDTESGIDQMQFSNDGLTYLEAEPYAATKPWTLTVGGGKKTIYAKFSDKAGNWSQAYSDDIILDTTAPAVPRIYRVSTMYNKASGKFNLYAFIYPQRDPESGAVRYKYSITEGSPTGAKDWSFASGLVGSTIRVLNLSLTKSKTYYFNVKAVNNAGLESKVVSVKIAAQQPQIPPPLPPHRRSRWW